MPILSTGKFFDAGAGGGPTISYAGSIPGISYVSNAGYTFNLSTFDTGGPLVLGDLLVCFVAEAYRTVGPSPGKPTGFTEHARAQMWNSLASTMGCVSYLVVGASPPATAVIPASGNANGVHAIMTRFRGADPLAPLAPPTIVTNPAASGSTGVNVTHTPTRPYSWPLHYVSKTVYGSNTVEASTGTWSINHVQYWPQPVMFFTNGLGMAIDAAWVSGAKTSRFGTGAIHYQMSIAGFGTAVQPIP